MLRFSRQTGRIQVSDYTIETKQMDNNLANKAVVLNTNDLIEYAPQSVVRSHLIRKTTGSISIVAFDAGNEMTKKISPFDFFIQIIDGKAEIVIDGKPRLLVTGQWIIIPAHSRSTFKAEVRFKMLSTLIKSGYDEVS